MDANAAAILNEGITLMRGFVSQVTPVPSVARPALWAANYKFPSGAWADKAEQYLSSNSGALSLEEQSKYRTAIAMARDIADQSPSHIDSLVARIGQQLQNSAPTPTAAPKPTAALGDKAVPGWAIALGVGALVWILLGRKRR